MFFRSAIKPYERCFTRASSSFASPFSFHSGKSHYISHKDDADTVDYLRVNELEWDMKLVHFGKAIARFSLVVAAVFSFASGAAFAIENEVDCRARISEMSQALLETNVDPEQLASIDETIQSARGLCDAGDFSGAEARLNEAKDMIAAATKS
jgi:hypothetical protein